MKLIERYLREKLKISPLGPIELIEMDDAYVSVTIDGTDTGIMVYYSEYARWLEKLMEPHLYDITIKLDKSDKDSQYDSASTEVENPYIVKEKQKTLQSVKNKTLTEFKSEVLNAVDNKPDFHRKGQATFNYIEEKYGVAREVQFEDKVDCFYDDSRIDKFIELAYKRIINK